MKCSAQLFQRTDYTKKDGTNPIYLRVIINRKKKDYSLNISVLPKHWNSKKDEIKMAAKGAIQNNLLIQKKLRKAKDIFFDFQMKDKYLNLFEFDRLYCNDSFNSKCFYEFVEKQIKLSKGKFSDGTIGTWVTQLSKLQKFRSDLEFGQIDVVFLKEYESYMINKLGNGQSTVGKSLSFLRNFLNRAKQEGILDANVFNESKYEIKKGKSERQFLTLQEIAKLEKLYASNELKSNKKNVLRYFLFACYTGLRYSDVNTLRYKHINDGILRKKLIKTGVVVEFPLISKAKALIEDGPSELMVFKVLADQPTNRYLKDICKEAGILKHISFHCARHSFATNSRELKVPLEIIQSVLGHTEIKETMTYTRVTQNQMKVVLEKWDT